MYIFCILFCLVKSADVLLQGAYDFLRLNKTAAAAAAATAAAAAEGVGVVGGVGR